MRRAVPISVVIPAYNSETFMNAAIATVRMQSVDVREIIVVDDGSGDDTAAAAERLGARVLRERHGGQAATRNAGIRAAEAPWIATLDADDIWHPRKLELQYEAIVAAPDLGLIFTDYDTVSAVDGAIEKADVIAGDGWLATLEHQRITTYATRFDFESFLRELAARFVILPSTAVFRRDIALQIGGFPLDVKAEDYDFFLRFASKAVTGFIDAPLVAYMRHPASVTANWNLDSTQLALHHHVVTNATRYHAAIVTGLRNRYPVLLYAMAVGAARRQEFAASATFLGKAFGAATVRNQLPALVRAVANSEGLRARLGRHAAIPAAEMARSTAFGEIDIPWRIAAAR